MNSPKISVCIPTYNYGQFIAETIESILSQNFTDFELLIIDDCSRDNTAQIVETFAKYEPRIRFSSNNKNLGMVANWNACLNSAQGDYIKYVFGDDRLNSPDALGKMVEPLERNGSVSLVSTARSIIDADSKEIRNESHFTDGMYCGTDVINYCLAKDGNLIGEPSSVMFRRHQAVRGFNPEYKQLVDLEMWFWLLEQGSLVFINESLCSFRVHEQQQTAANAKSFAVQYDNYCLRRDYIHKKYIDLPGLLKKYLIIDAGYGIWKSYRNGAISRVEAIRLINAVQRYTFFCIAYPGYKIVKPFYKFLHKFGRHLLPPEQI